MSDNDEITLNDREFRVALRRWCFTYVNVRVDATTQREVAANLDVEPAALTVADLRETAADLAFRYGPGDLDAVSGGWNQTTDQGLPWSRELNEYEELAENPDDPDDTSAVEEVTGERRDT